MFVTLIDRFPSGSLSAWCPRPPLSGSRENREPRRWRRTLTLNQDIFLSEGQSVNRRSPIAADGTEWDIDVQAATEPN
jgi:hypothetical protein